MFNPRVLYTCSSFTGTTGTTHKRRRIVRMFITVTALFVCCWMPYHVIELVHDTMEVFEGEESTDSAFLNSLRVASILLSLSNSWFNPIIYFLHNVMYRKAVMKLACMCCYKKNRVHVTPSAHPANFSQNTGLELYQSSSTCTPN